MTKSNIEEIIGILWLILCVVSVDKAPKFAALAFALGAMSLMVAVYYAWAERKVETE